MTRLPAIGQTEFPFEHGLDTLCLGLDMSRQQLTDMAARTPMPVDRLLLILVDLKTWPSSACEMLAKIFVAVRSTPLTTPRRRMKNPYCRSTLIT
jgi:hypothetical protein